MSKSGYLKIGNINPTEPITIPLKIMDYVFCYKGIDLSNAIVKYWFDKIQYVEYEDGKRKEEEFSPTIYFSISAEDKNKNIYSFSFTVNMNVDMLNKISDNPLNINKYIIQGEIFFWDPLVDSEVPEFMDFSLEENIYSFATNYVVQKIDDKKFVFKIQYQDLFIWFHIDFNEK